MDTMEEKRYLSDKFMLRMPDGMRDRIKAKADENGRSMNGEILQLLLREYPEETYTAEDFFQLLLESSSPLTSLEQQIDNQEMINTTLRHLNVDFEAHFESGDIVLTRRNR